MVYRKKGKIESISAIISRAYPSQHPEQLPAPQAMAWWRKAVSRRILKNARPVRLSQGVLTIHTSTSAWANSLQYESESLLKTLSSYAPDPKIRKLYFCVGPLPKYTLPIEEEKPSTVHQSLMELPESVALAIAKIRNDDVRDAVAQAASAGLANVQSENSRNGK